MKLLPLCRGTNCPSSVLIDIGERSLQDGDEAACPHEACPRLEIVYEDPPIDVGDVDLDLGLDTECTEDLTALLSDGDRSMSSDEDVVADLNLPPLDVQKLSTNKR